MTACGPCSTGGCSNSSARRRYPSRSSDRRVRRAARSSSGPGEPLPWRYLRRPTSAGAARRRWQHTVYLGLYDLEDVYQYLHHAFAEDRDAYDERRAGSSACAAVMLDDRGVLMVDSATLSSALWAVAQIRDSGAAPSPQWAGGFSRAAQEFKEEADVVEGLRREAALAETAPPQDEDSLWTLLHIAHEASGIAGTPRLDSQRIIISSVVVSDHRAGDTTADIDFLNSFFLDDLAAVQVALADGRCPSALSEYLTADALLPTDLRSDVMTEHPVARRPARRGPLRIVPGGHAPPRGLPGQRGR